MRLGAFVLACGALLGGIDAANAACAVGDPNWPAGSVQQAQRLARFSADGTVSGAYTASTCTITALVHQSGDPCPGTQDDNHATIRVNNVMGAYHVFTTQVDGGFCTTH